MSGQLPPYQWQAYHGFWISDIGISHYSIVEWVREKAKEYGAQWEVKAVRSAMRDDVLGVATDNVDVAALFKLTFADRLLSGNQV